MSKTLFAEAVEDGRGNIRLAPMDALSEETMRGLPKGARLNLTITIAKANTRDDQHTRLLSKYHAGISELYENVDGAGPGLVWPTKKHLRSEILRELGFYVAIPQIDGSVRKQVDSMALDAMEFDDLQVCFELTRTYVQDRWGFDPWQEYEDAHPERYRK